MSESIKTQTFYDQTALHGGADNQITVRCNNVPRRFDDEYDPSDYRPKRRFHIPAVVNSGLSILFAGALFFGMEAVAPERLRPSTLVGTYEGRVESAVASAVKASELRQQAVIEDYMAQLRVYAEQNNEHYKAIMLTYADNYRAVYDRGKIVAQAAVQMQTEYQRQRMALSTQFNSADIGVSQMATIIGRGMNLFEAGAGDAALNYANNIKTEVIGEFTEDAKSGSATSIVDWDVSVPPPDTILERMESLKPMPLPVPPRFQSSLETK